MEEHLTPTILDNFENNCESMEIKRTNAQAILRGGVENTNLQFMNIHSRDQEFIDHTLLGPEYIGNSFMIDLMDEEQHDVSGQTTSDCSIATLGSHESFPSEAQMNSILQFVNRQGHIRNHPHINGAESTNDHLIHNSDKEIIDSEFLAMHGNLLNDQNLKLFCSPQIIPSQESISSDLNVSQLHSLSSVAPTLRIAQTSWHKKDSYHQESIEEPPGDILEHLGTTARKVLPHKKRISKKLKNLDKPDSSNSYDLIISPETTPIANNRFVSSNGSHYECELCGSISESQVQFFSHLKGHYEPISIVEAAQPPIERISTPSISVGVDDVEPVIKESESRCDTEEQQDQEVFNEVELNFENFNEVVELTAQKQHHQPTNRNAPITADMKMLDSNSIEKCMQYVTQAQEPTHQVHHVRSEEVEFSDAEDMLEGIRGVVDKVSIDDASNDLNIRPKDIAKESWFGNNGAYTFKEEINNSENFEKPANYDDCKTPLNSIDFNEVTEECADTSMELNNTIIQLEVQEINNSSSNITRRGRPKGTSSAKKTFKTPHTNDRDNDDTGSDEFVENIKKRYICTKCNREFNSCNALKYHNLSHTGERPHQCDVCGKSFYGQSALKSHLRLHTGDKPYECEQCNRKFRQWSDVKYHIASIHSEEKNYTCEFCGKSFSRKYSLVIHRRIHTSERNYKCEFCPKSFRASSYLQNHRKIHTGEKPYTCETCGKKFRVCGDLRRHSRIHERKGVTKDQVLPEQSRNSSVNNKLDKMDNIKTDVLLKIEYQKETKDDLLFLDKMASKIENLFKTEEDFVNEDIGNSDLSFVS